MCAQLGVSRSGFYAWARRGPSMHANDDARISVFIGECHRKSRGTYGSPRVHQSLRSRGVRAGRKRVARLMRESELRGVRKRRFVKTTMSSHGDAVAPNLLARNFAAAQRDRAWVGDITYMSSHEGNLYLATVIDLHSRRIVGWCIDDHMRADLACRALQMAVDQRRPPPGAIFHSDRGSQYTSNEFQELLKVSRLVSSMSAKGECWDSDILWHWWCREAA